MEQTSRGVKMVVIWGLRLTDILTIFSLLVGPTIGVVITLWYHKKRQRYEAKERLFLTVMAHRKSFPPTYDWAMALNSIVVVYADNSKILELWNKLYEVANQKPFQQQAWDHAYLNLLSAMAISLNYRNIQQTDIDKFYAPDVHGAIATLQAEIQVELRRLLKGTKAVQTIPIDEEKK
jgi:hypothetical protein